MTGHFVKVQCPECNNEQPVFSRAATEVVCNACGGVLATPTGGSAILQGAVVAELE